MRHTFRVQLVAASLAAAGSSLAAAEPRLDVGPAYRFLGTYLQGETFEIEVPIANTGDALLVVQQVTTDCNCVTAKAKKPSLAPQQKSILRIETETRDFLGRLRREVRIASNDPQTPTARLVLEYDVVRPITLAPAALQLGVIRPGQRLTRTVAIRVQGDAHVRLLYATVSEPAVRVVLPDKAATARGDFDLEVTLQAPDRIGPYRASVVIHTDSRSQPQLRLPIRASLSADVTVSSPTIQLGATRDRPEIGATVTVRCVPPTTIGSCSLSSKFLQIERIAVDDALRLRVTSTRHAALGTIAAVLSIETIGRETQTIHLPVRGRLTTR